MRVLLLVLRLGWLACWIIAARGAKGARWRERLRRQWPHGALALAGTVIPLVPRATPAVLAQSFLPPSPLPSAIGIGTATA